jgi:WD40 repeat protein
MPRLFISHSGKENFEALAFRDWLISEGWAASDVFLDLHTLGAGERWKEALAKANERCEAVVLLASPASLASTECRVEIRMAEDYGKEIVVAILHLLKVEDPELGPYRDRQVVDLSTEPREAMFTVTHQGQQRTVAFHKPTLARIKARLDQLGISPTSFAWRPGDLATASPYPGLKGFEAADAALFFGREADIARGLAEIRKLRRLPHGQLFVIQAASGAGKSSFLKAGLWPRLARDPETVPLAMLRPATGILTGDTGIGRQFAAFFGSQGGSEYRDLTPAAIHQALRQGDDAALAFFANLINKAAAIGHASLRIANPEAAPPTPLIAVDQAEELFAAADLEESLRFLKLLAGLLDPDRAASLNLVAPPLILWTLRADSLDALLHATDAAGLKPPALFALPPIPATAYRDVILTPLEVANEAGMKLAMDPLLVDALVAKSQGADALPLLAFTLRQLFADNRSGATARLTLANFEAAGGIEGVLAARLAAAKRGAGVGDEALRLLFLPNLCTWDADANPPGAKRLIAKEADLLAGERASLAPLAQALVAERLLTRSGGAGGAVTLEVAHEALLRQPPISPWLEEDREFLVWREGVARARAGYEANRRGLLLGRELEIARSWMGTRAADIPEADQAFIGDSIAAETAARDAEAERERERQTKELALAQEREKAARDLAEAAKQVAAAAQKTTRRTAVGLALAAIAAVVAIVFYVQADRRKQAAQLRESQLLGGLSEKVLNEGTPLEAALIALEALPDKTSANPVTRSRPFWAPADGRLLMGLSAMNEAAILKGHTDAVNSVASSPDGARVLTGSWDKTAKLWDAKTGAGLLTLEGHTDGVLSVAFSPDGARVLTGSEDETAKLWDAKTGAEIFTLKGQTDSVRSVAFSPDGTRVLTGSDDKTAKLWDAKTGAEILTLKGHTGRVFSVAFSPDGVRVLTGSDDKTAKLWDAKTGAEILTLKGHTNYLFSVAFSPDGARVLTGSYDETAQLWDAKTGAELLTLTGHMDHVTSVAFSPDGARVLTGSRDKTAKLWDAKTGAEILTLKGHPNWVESVAFSPDGARVLTGSWDKTARLWDAKTGAEILTLNGHPRYVSSVAFSPDGARVLTGSWDNTAKLWDAKTGAELITLKGHTGYVTSVAFSPDGARVLTGSTETFGLGDKTAKLWDAKTGAELLTFTGHASDITSVAFSPDGTRVLTGSEDKTAKLWNANTGAELLTLRGHTNHVSSVAFSPDGARVLTGSWDNTAKLWDAKTGAELLTLKGHTDSITSVAYSPDGARVLTGSEDNTAKLWDAKTGAELLTLKGHTKWVASVAFSPDGARVLTGSHDKTAKLWDAKTGQPLVDAAKQRLPRCLTPHQRKQYLLAPEVPEWCYALKKWPYDRAPFAIAEAAKRKAKAEAN